MTTDLDYLVELQKHDSLISDIKEKAAEFDPKIKQQKDTLASLKDSLKSAKDKITNLQVKKKDLENNVASKENIIQKHNGELNQLKSNEAYKKMLDEIEAAKKELSDSEDQILINMEETDQAQGEFKAKEDEIKNNEKTILDQIKGFEAEKAKILAEAKAKEGERNTYAQTVPEALRSQYETLKEKRDGVAIVPVIHNACGECRMNITQNKLNDIKLSKDIVVCEACARILYLPKEESSDSKTVSPA